jgi:hypothetical protein
VPEVTLEEALDAIQNLIGFLDTPLGRRRNAGEFNEEAVRIAKDVLQRSGRTSAYDWEERT